MNKMSNLRSYFPNYLTGAIFKEMVAIGAPWTEEVALDMDDVYFSMYSGVKTATEFLTLHSTDGVADSTKVAKLLWAMNGGNWKRLWESYILEYSPITNYKLDETVVRTQTNDTTVDKTVNSTYGGTSSVQHGMSVSVESSNNEFTFGFDSTEGSPSSKSDGTSTTTNSGTDTTTDSSNNDTTDKTVGSDKEDENITRTKEGNIGQNSYQELLRQEFELWKWNFYTRVFEDCDKYLTLSIF